MAKRAYRQTCASCGESLPYGSWHCLACVETKRVCQMCDTSITDKRTDATFCGQSCKQAESRQRNAITGENSGNNGNVTDVTAILEAAKRIEDAASAMPSPGKTSGALLETIAENTGMTLTQIEDMTKAINRLAAAMENQPRAATPGHTIQQAPARNVSDDDLMDMLEVKAAEYDPDNNSSYNFILSVAGVASGSEFNLPPEVYEYAVRTGRMKAAPNNGPRQMDVPVFDEPDEDSFNDLIDLL